MAGGKLISTGVEFPDATTQTTSGLPLTGGALTGAVTTTSTFDGRDVAADGVTADAALPKAGGTMTGTIAGFTSTGIDDNATSNAITIDASENVGIGTTSPATQLNIAGTTGMRITYTGASSAGVGAPLTLYTDDGAAMASGDRLGYLIMGGAYDASSNLGSQVAINGYASQAWTSTARGSHMSFQTTSNGATGRTERMRIDSAGDVTVNTGNLVIGTSGKGIDFSASTDGTGTVTSEVLDDYEEGTWTPTISGQTTSGTGTYSEQSGTYTKVGNKVTVNCALAWSAHTGTGNMRISGQPFTTATGIYAGSLYYSDFFVSATADDLFVYTAGTRIDFRGGRLDGSSREVVTIDTAGTMYITITYLV